MQNKISEVFHDNHISKWSLVNLEKKASRLKELNTDLALIYKILQGKNMLLVNVYWQFNNFS